ncbi:hypothetical protein P175DRAFT_028934 [Aspergillus ochraceoroseus IBT 24754]|uniref:Uncharacterized protein n=3 Tax=Aspergillus subgen. Nidulantes TaxID=2720870 RepID=A0A0F8V2R8_9EURO|nr:uncharacterized protein P175DRAFT_028934 [Aspergillus ochraceoroseus IBT 24754]KKK12130.1 hypothetical protein AOCH_002666 [Aspergillus ochraceoroseus]KKK26059.1 hypothetical protein ARAM_005119 [Aspergillus rambellii]PTU24334.1 hypothetical protein P175DRAFT_028934 [Aspergillus ochraceoroseus IBT 24754]
MGAQNMSRKSWESLSSTFSNLEISISRDSCYASDEVSVTSTTPVITNAPTVPPLAPSGETSIRPLLKPILKRPYSEIEEDEQSESGYASNASEYEYDDIFEETDGDMCDIPDWDDNEIMSEYYEDDIESLDGSFISFESAVRFDSHVHYIEAPEPQEEESAETGMTCHEMMAIAQASANGNNSQEETYTDTDDSNCEAISESIEQLPEHTSDILDLDKRLFVAYMNGINGITNPDYRARLRARVSDFRSGRVSSPFLDLDSANGVYLDHVLSHVIGTFRSIVVKAEFDELLGLGTEATSSLDQNKFDKIEHLLFERLAVDDVSVGPDELSFFASGVAYALENWQCYAPN